ncbi:MarR family winged helix-turn-helix transcriptional regulator [Streptomyces scabiei]|uniref:MarR family winged helix-turn-helix transcriptional regulator n=1 Tax=Streptomyces scabiei TaxID=1930 RepID=UPI0029A2566D|nr:MarR family transcriptional regulator [Streptomyces scabiei]MDX3517914.1 MarR family transcriptional regulator [Streptomyces scabiei]
MSELLHDQAVVMYGDILRLTDAIGGRAERIIRETTGLGGSEFEVLLRLTRHPESRTTSARLAEDLSFTSGGLTRLIARMEEAGLLARHPHPDDRRAALLEATPKGRDALERALAAHAPQVTADLVEPLTPVERLILRELVTKLLAHSARGTVQGPVRP